MTTSPCIFIDDPLPADLAAAHRELGGKGMSLRRLSAAGVRVPYGFTICASVCRSFLTDHRWPEDAWGAVVDAVSRLSREQSPTGATGADVLPTADSLQLAVRSGAAESLPGLLRTHLNVGVSSIVSRGEPGEDIATAPLRRAIEDVYCSWNTDAARVYRRQQAIDDDMATAVTVQEMIGCNVSGVLFTRAGAATSDRLLIEAVRGTGESLVSGQETPLQWVVSRCDLSLCEAPDNLDDNFAAFGRNILELARLGIDLERTFGEPLDIEWGHDDDGFVFFQARGIVPTATATADNNADNIARGRLREQLKRLDSRGSRYWVRHNLSETLVNPTPLTWSVWQQFLSGGGGLARLYRLLGYRPGRDVENGSFLELIGNTVYADPMLAAAMFGDAFPWTYDLDRLQERPEMIDEPPRHFDPAQLDPFFLWRIPELLWRMWHSRRRLSRWLATAAERFDNEIVPPFRGYVSTQQQMDLTAIDDHELPQLFESRRRQVMDVFGPESLLPGTIGAMAFYELRRQIGRVLGDDAAQELLTRSFPNSQSNQTPRLLNRLSASAGDDSMDLFLTEFGHRAIGEVELATPRWRDTPERVRQLARTVSAQLPSESAEQSPRTEDELERMYADAGALSLCPPVLVWYGHCRRLLPCREQGKHELMRGYELLRQVAEEMGHRSGLGDDIYYLRAEEWPALLAGSDVSSRISERRAHAAAVQYWKLPDVIDTRNGDSLLTEEPVGPQTGRLQGTPLVPGRARGHVWRFPESLQPPECQPAVLTCTALEPAMLPLLARSVAVVVQQGGALSHGAILARQLGLPVVRVSNATQALAAGELVHVDADTGSVEVIDKVPS